MKIDLQKLETLLSNPDTFYLGIVMIRENIPGNHGLAYKCRQRFNRALKIDKESERRVKSPNLDNTEIKPTSSSWSFKDYEVDGVKSDFARITSRKLYYEQLRAFLWHQLITKRLHELDDEKEEKPI
jgi:hypothetical protein